MAEYDFPDDLLQLRRAWLEADARCDEIAARLPSSVDVVALEAEKDEEGIASLVEARSERLELTEEINRHAFWEGCDNRYSAWMALNKAAKEVLATAEAKA